MPASALGTAVAADLSPVPVEPPRQGDLSCELIPEDHFSAAFAAAARAALSPLLAFHG